jgi:hypothetical protein
MVIPERTRKKMKQELHKIDIFPAIFLGYDNNGQIHLECLHGYKKTIIENRIFNKIMIEGIKNPKYLLFGIMTGVGFMQINVCDGSNYEKYFKTKWKILIK